MSFNNNYGKSLLLKEVERIFYNFLEYQVKISNIIETKKKKSYFIEQIELLEFFEANIVYIDFEYLVNFSEELADLIEEQYIRIENILRKSFIEFYTVFLNKGFYLKNSIRNQVKIGFYNLPNWKNFSELGNCNYGKLICTIGKIVRIIEPEPTLFISTFRCSNHRCNNKVKFEQNINGYEEPKICQKCKGSDSWEIITEESVFIEVQKIRIQEIVINQYKKNPPIILDAFLVDEGTNVFNLGSKCVFTGSLAPLPFKKINLLNNYLDLKAFDENFSMNLLSGMLFYPTLIIQHIFLLGSRVYFKNLQKSAKFLLKKKTLFFNRKEKEAVLKLKNWSFLNEKAKSLLFNEMEKYENLRMGILLMLVGGVEKKITKNQFFRENINISILYPPFTIFDDLYMEVKNLDSNVNYANGLISNSNGFTATIIRDSETNSLCVESGLFSGKNKNFYFVENFHNLNPRNQKLITDCTEKQEFRINKAEIKLTLKSKISIIAATELSKTETIGLQTTPSTKFFNNNLMKKFDLNFFFIEGNDFRDDFQFSKKYISDNKMKRKKKKNEVWSIQIYLSFVKNLSPVIPKESYIFILNVYLFLKKNFSDQKKTIIEISSRQLETLIRLSEAVGKLLMSFKIQEYHIKVAIKIMFSSFYFFRNSKNLEKNVTELIGNFGTDYPSTIPTTSGKMKFFDFNFIVEKISFIVKNRINDAFSGVSIINVIKAFFLHFSTVKHNKVGLKLIKKFIKTLRNITCKNERFFVVKLSNNSRNSKNYFLFNEV